MTPASGEGDAERARAEAADWFAKARGPDAARWEPAIVAWRALKPENDAAYARLQRRWEQSVFLANTGVGRGRDLRAVSAWSRRPGVRQLAAAAALLILVGLGAILLARFRPAGRTETRFVDASTARQVRAIALADGSRVTLDANSTIRILGAEKERKLRLIRGRARFEVARAPGRPFVVDANGSSITTNAGLFDVALSGPLIKVVLWHGGLDVRPRLKSAVMEGRPARIAVGQQLVLRSTGEVALSAAADPGEMGWVNGMLSFDRVRLADAVVAFGRYNDIHVVFDPPRIGDLRVSGAFRATDPQGFARAVANMFDLELIHEPDGAIRLRPGKKA